MSNVFDDRTLAAAHRPPRHRPHPLLDHRLEHVAQRPAGLPQHRRLPVRPRPQRQPRQHRGAGRRARACCPGTVTSDSDLDGRAAGGRAARGGLRRRGASRRPRLERALERVLPRLEGAFSLVLMDAERVIGVRDPNGLRPLCLGRLDDGWVLASESPALDIVGAKFVREIEPGEVVVIGRDGPRSLWPFPPERIDPKLCLFEFVYFARPDSQLYGQSVHHARVRQGELLAEQAPLPDETPYPDAEGMVMGVPEIGRARGRGLRPGQRHPLRPGPGEEPLHRPHVHRPEPGDAGPRRAHEVQPAAGQHRRPAPRGGRRLDRAGHHPEAARADAARGRRPRGPPAPHLAAGPLAVLLRHGLRRHEAAARRQPRRRGDPRLPRRRHARLHRPRPAARVHRRRPGRVLHACFTGDVPGRRPGRAAQGHARDRRAARHRPGLVRARPAR